LKREKGARERILDQALKIAKEQGIEALTQPRVATAAGVRQSHLTYYFPRKADLLAAVLQASHADAAEGGEPAEADAFAAAMKSLEALMFDRNRMRFFLGVAIEASTEKNLRDILAAHARGLTEQIAPLFGRTADDPAVIAFIDRLRGMGVRLLLEPDRKRRGRVNIEAIAAESGLRRA